MTWRGDEQEMVEREQDNDWGWGDNDDTGTGGQRSRGTRPTTTTTAESPCLQGGWAVLLMTGGGTDTHDNRMHPLQFTRVFFHYIFDYSVLLLPSLLRGGNVFILLFK
jgi:hypothetical protein